MAPFDGVKKSDHVSTKTEPLPEPFLALQLDVAAWKALQTGCREELSKPMLQFVTAEHMDAVSLERRFYALGSSTLEMRTRCLQLCLKIMSGGLHGTSGGLQTL
jgi:hypothetical protein